MPTAAIRMEDGHGVHSCGNCEVHVPMGSRSIAYRFSVMDTSAVDFVLGTNFFASTPRFHSSCCKRTMSFMWNMVTDGTLYRWSSLSTPQAT